MYWVQFLLLCAVIVAAGRFLAREGEILAEKTGMGRSWIGAVLVAATTSLPELFAGVGATAVYRLPEIAVGDVVGSCMFNLLILSMMDLVAGNKPLSSRASAGHALAIGFGTILLGIAGLALVAATGFPAWGWVGVATPVLFVIYLLSTRVMFLYERRRVLSEPAAELLYGGISTKGVVARYTAAAIVVVAAAIFLPKAGAEIAGSTGLDQGFVGTLFIAVATSLPEVSVSLAAVRAGSIDLVVGNVLGSNLFNVLILTLDDVLYTPGPILASVSGKHAVAIFAVLAMNGIALSGLTYQATQKRLILAWDTLAIAGVYALALTLYVTL